jgi:hypothetical protein
MVEFLIEEGANIHETNKEDLNALDLAIIRVGYETALLLKQKGLEPKPCEFYHDKLTVVYDLELFLQKLENEDKVDKYSIFYERIKREEKEWLSKDLVYDPRENWKVSIFSF